MGCNHQLLHGVLVLLINLRTLFVLRITNTTFLWPRIPETVEYLPLPSTNMMLWGNVPLLQSRVVLALPHSLAKLLPHFALGESCKGKMGVKISIPILSGVSEIMAVKAGWESPERVLAWSRSWTALIVSVCCRTVWDRT